MAPYPLAELQAWVKSNKEVNKAHFLCLVGLFEESIQKLHSDGLHVEGTVLAVACSEMGVLLKNIDVDAMVIALVDSFQLSELNTAGICMLNLIK